MWRRKDSLCKPVTKARIQTHTEYYLMSIASQLIKSIGSRKMFYRNIY